MSAQPNNTRAQATTWRLGTIGFAYDDWAGPFYPEGLRAERRLAWYAQRFGAIELDTTFYATPRVEVVRRWAAATPDGFRFAIKAPREVTHDPGLIPSAEHISALADRFNAFLDVMRELGGKLGVVLLQYPPACRVDLFEELSDFLHGLPRDVAYAVELRHASWWTEQTVTLLRELNATHGLRIAWVGADYPTPEVAGVSPGDELQGGKRNRPLPLIHTGEFMYVRWVGNHGQLPRSDAEVLDPTPRLRWWADRLGPLLRAGSPVREVYGFFGNSYAGHAPATCRRFAMMMGLGGSAVDDPAPAQGRLF